MFTDLTFAENTELYMKLHRASGLLGRLAGLLIGFGCYDAAAQVNAMTTEAVYLLEDLNAAAKRDMRTIAGAL